MMKNRMVVISALLVLVLVSGIWFGMTLKSGAGSPAEPNQIAGANELVGYDGPSKEVTAVAAGVDWCAEHRVPESECTLCHPELIEKFKTSGDWCGEHGLPESHCRLCNPSLVFAQEPVELTTAEPIQISVFFPPNKKGCVTDQAIIRFASEHTADRIGLKVEPVVASNAASLLEAPAEIVFDEGKVQAITLAVPATVTRWLVEPGERVTRGQPLAELRSPEVADLKSRYLAAAADWTRKARQWKRGVELRDKQMISQAELDLSEADEKAALSQLRGVEGQLKSIGIQTEDIDSLAKYPEAGATWIFRTDHAASLLERRAPLGEQLEAGSTLALIGDPSELWIRSQVRDVDLSKCRVGQTVEFTTDGESLNRALGRVIWVAQYLDPQTRTGEVRAKVFSGGKSLRAHLFGRVDFRADTSAPGLLVPKDAVQWEGCCHIVFVQEAIDRYRPRKVVIERGDNRHYLVNSGLQAGELVVTTASFLLKTELNKDNLGAGCCSVE